VKVPRQCPLVLLVKVGWREGEALRSEEGRGSLIAHVYAFNRTRGVMSVATSILSNMNACSANAAFNLLWQWLSIMYRFANLKEFNSLWRGTTQRMTSVASFIEWKEMRAWAPSNVRRWEKHFNDRNSDIVD
jgi:hypothetical protein